MIDGYGGSENKLNDKDLVRKCLDELPDRLEMKVLANPEVYFAKPNDKKDPGGWTGFVVIAESHISIHTFPKRGFLSADIYTCKNNMDKKVIINFMKDAFELQSVETNFVKRGISYPLENIYL